MANTFRVGKGGGRIKRKEILEAIKIFKTRNYYGKTSK